MLVDDESSIDATPWLTTDPNPGMSSTPGNDTDSPLSNPGGDLLREAMQHRAEGEYAEALQDIKSILTSGNVEVRVKKWATYLLVALSHKLPQERLAQYVGTLISAQPGLMRQLKTVLPHLLLHEGSSLEAQTAFQSNMQQYPNTAVECAALYGKFIHALYSNKDIAMATTLKSLLDNRYPESGERFMAGLQLQNYPGSSASQQLALGPKKALNSTPAVYKLEQNFPNPFNPSTTIRYSIAVDERVTLKIFDVLGREVLLLVDEHLLAGEHTTILDANRLASGVYLYRLSAGTYTATKKFVLLK